MTWLLDYTVILLLKLILFVLKRVTQPIDFYLPGSDVSARDNYGKSPLTLAVEKGNEANVGYLIQNGNADIHSADENGITPLLMAAKKNQLSIFKFLLSKGSDPKVKDEIYGWNSLFWLSAHGNVDGVCIKSSPLW